MRIPPLPPLSAAIFAEVLDDPILSEQYLDFLRCRCFRRSLLCHREAALDRTIAPERLLRMYAASAFAPDPDADLCAEGPVEFCGPQGRKAVADHPLTKAALSELADVWPAALPFAELLARVRSRLGGAGAEPWVATLRHTAVRPEGPVERRLLVLLGGTRDRPALLRDLGEPDLTPERLQQNLVRLARLGLLVC